MNHTTLKTLAILAASGSLALAADTAVQRLNFQIRPFVDIQVADTALSLVIDNIALGGIGKATASSSYSLVNNKTNQKITASLDARMPQETKLQLVAAAPSGAQSSGDVELSDKAVDIAVKVNQVNQKDLNLAYTFTASEKAGTEPFVRTVTYTVVEM
ncbi:MAG: hypothetical protein JNL97_08455 [Verrucomicrobiales bacterium]|nr:hypothetical protein [Verrucomicrobiales bacterium]